MITTVVQFVLSHPVTLEEASKMFESTAPRYRNLPGLVRKYYVRSEDGRRVGGIYFWETKAAAEKCFNGEWQTRVRLLYGGEPQITYFETPVIVDNLAGGSITKAA